MSSPSIFQEELFKFSRLADRQLSVKFSDPHTSSDGGTLLLRETENLTNIIGHFASSLPDKRNSSYVKHSYEELIGQRIYQLATGYEDCNDCDFLKNDPLFQIASKNELGKTLGSQPTMSRLENSISQTSLLRGAFAICDNFLNSFSSAPELIIIDMDPTENKVYGDQQLSLFNGFVDDYCFMPFHVYDGMTGQLITTVLRPGKTPGGKEIVAILKRIVKRIRTRFPQTQLIFRADSHHARKEVLDYLEDNSVYYIIGLSKHLLPRNICSQLSERALLSSKNEFTKVRLFHNFHHKVNTWRQTRRIICRAEANGVETDLRYIVTNLSGKSKFLYEKLYCDRGNAELRIKDSKSGLHSDRTSCHRKEANQFRLLLNAAAYQLVHSFRQNILRGTKWANATFKTIQLKIFKVAARIEVKKTFIRVHMPETSIAKQVYQKFSHIVMHLKKI